MTASTAYLQSLDLVIANGREASVVFVWPDRTLVRVQYRDTGQKATVKVSDVQIASAGVDTGRIHYVQGRLDPRWYWPRSAKQKAHAKAGLGLFFAQSPFGGAQEVAERMHGEMANAAE